MVRAASPREIGTPGLPRSGNLGTQGISRYALRSGRNQIRPVKFRAKGRELGYNAPPHTGDSTDFAEHAEGHSSSAEKGLQYQRGDVMDATGAQTWARQGGHGYR